MRNDKDSLKLAFIKRRTAIIKCFYAIFTLILVIKLIKIQIIEYFFYKKKAENNFIKEQFLLPNRGIIYDRNMVEIANTISSYKALYFINHKNDLHDINVIYNILNRPKHKTIALLNAIEKKIPKSKNKELVLAQNLTSEEIIRLKFNKIYLPKLKIQKYNMRKYPFNEYTSTLIGYVMGIRNTKNKIAQSNPDYKIGHSGIEKIFEKNIGGSIGIQYNFINAMGVKVNEITTVEPINGQNVITTIDQRLQTELYKLFNNKNGSATLLDVRTGAILAMVSKPNIDPNLASIGISNEDWVKITQNTEINSGIFTNKNITATYPPGSVFKIVSSLTGLVYGLNPYKKYNCTGEYKIGNRVFHCWKKDGHGLVDLDKAIAQSCNCYFYKLSQQISSKNVHDIAKKLGLCDKHMPDFQEEVIGLVGNQEWAKKKGISWTIGDNANLIIGQGYTNLTPIQLAVMISRIATNKKIEPRFLLENEVETFPSLGFDEKLLSTVQHGLFSAVNSDYRVIQEIVDKKYQVCGKTGTSQVISKRIKNSDIKHKKISYNEYSHGLFVGYAPFDNPRYAVSVVVEHGISGAGSAAPIGAKILAKSIIQENEQ